MQLNRNISFFAILDNIRSLENVGSIFRTSDAFGITKIYLGGISGMCRRGAAKFLNPKISKTALGAELNVSWEHDWQTWRIIDKLKKEGVKIVCLEQTKKAIDILKFRPKFPLALVVGNEINGVSKAILKRADAVVQIPMLGKKESLNVAVAFGIAAFEINKSCLN
ncbi:MAG: TrmH family RNA methyltransferase [bacterium]|nr:TrmH family RNA methyltransferase [bacterium]